MLLLIMKWVVGLLVLAIITIVGVGLLQTKTFHVETFIAAPPEKVWKVLMDTASYPDWNPTFIKVEGTYEEGSTVTNLVQEPNKTTSIQAKVKRVLPKQLLNQSGGLPGVITFDHHWKLEPAKAGTMVIQHEIDRGFYLFFWDSSWVQPAYERTSEALRERVLELSK